MAKKRSATLELTKQRNNRVLRLDYVELVDEDVEWLAVVERLTLHNVKVPAGLLARLEKLWWLYILGGSATGLEVARGVTRLQYFAINQVRGMSDLSVISEMKTLRYLELYGLPKVTHLPSFSGLAKLEHATLGQMRGLQSLHGLLDAPQLRELQLVRKININANDVDGIINHPTIKHFNWFAADVPMKLWMPVVERISLPAVPCLNPEKWFGLPEFDSAGKS